MLNTQANHAAWTNADGTITVAAHGSQTTMTKEQLAGCRASCEQAIRDSGHDRGHADNCCPHLWLRAVEEYA